MEMMWIQTSVVCIYITSKVSTAYLWKFGVYIPVNYCWTYLEEMKEELRDQLKNPLGETGDKLNLTSTSLSNALKEVQDEVNNTRTTLGTDFEDVMISINNALYVMWIC